MFLSQQTNCLHCLNKIYANVYVSNNLAYDSECVGILRPSSIFYLKKTMAFVVSKS